MLDDFIKDLGKEVVSAIGLALAAGMGYIISLVKEIASNRKLKKREKFKVAFERDKFLGETLVEVRNDFEADSACIFQVEMEKLKGAAPVEVMRLAYEKEKGFLKPWIVQGEEAPRLLVAEFDQTEEKLKSQPFVVIKDTEGNTAEENRILRLIVKHQITGVILVLIPSEKKLALGVLWLTYVKDLYEPTEFDLIKLKKHIKQISYLLSNYE